MKKIHFYISNSNHHWAMMKPIIETLSKKEDVAISLISLCEFRRMNTPVDELKKMKVQYEVLGSLKVRGTTTSTGKTSIGGNQAFLRNFLRSIIWYTKLRPALLRFLNNNQPDLVVVPNDVAYPFDKICNYFNKENIPFVLFQEGIRFPLPNEEGLINYGKNGAKIIMTWGKKSSEYFESIVSNFTRVISMGNPRFDLVVNKDYGEEIKSIRKAHSLGRINLMYISNPIDDQGFTSHEEKLHMFDSFLKRVKELLDRVDLKIIIRLHPRESKDSFRKIIEASEMQEHTLFIDNVSLFSLLQISDAAVVLASTVGLESVMMGTPVGVLKLPRHGYIFDYVSSGVACGIDIEDHNSYKEIELLVSSCTEEQKAKMCAYTKTHLANLGESKEFITKELVRIVHE